jgi:heparosan-N-sulfate-glucuronate 5-epimerase
MSAQKLVDKMKNPFEDQTKESNQNSKVLGEYYLNMRPMVSLTESHFYGPFDENQIPLVFHHKGGWVYGPVTIAQYALGNFELFLDTGDRKYKEVFLRQANWLNDTLKTTLKGFGVWFHSCDHPDTRVLKAPWASAMAQGEGISVLLRAYQLTKRSSYLEKAKQAFGALQFDISEGGVKFTDASGDLWFEEFPSDPPSHVLNGFIFTLFGVYDFFRVTKSERALNLLEKGVKTLQKSLHLYDAGYWSVYDQLDKQLVSRDYHYLHINQLKALYGLTNKKVFLTYAQRWEGYLNDPICKSRAILKRAVLQVRIELRRYGVRGLLRRINIKNLLRFWREAPK